VTLLQVADHESTLNDLIVRISQVEPTVQQLASRVEADNKALQILQAERQHAHQFDSEVGAERDIKAVEEIIRLANKILSRVEDTNKQDEARITFLTSSMEDSKAQLDKLNKDREIGKEFQSKLETKLKYQTKQLEDATNILDHLKESRYCHSSLSRLFSPICRCH
jgi:hypothetical protein